MMPTTAPPAQPKGAAPDASIATVANKLAGLRCAACRKPIRDLDPIVTTPRALRPTHFGCAPAATPAALAHPDEAQRCWYVEPCGQGSCPFPIRAANVCTTHHLELYGPLPRKR